MRFTVLMNPQRTKYASGAMIRQVFEAADFGPEIASAEDALLTEIGKNVDENRQGAKP